MTLTGAESLPDAYAAIDAVIHSHVVEWKLDQELREKREHERWIEGVTAVGLLIGFCCLGAYSPQIVKYFLDLFFSTNPNDTAPPSSPEESAAPPSSETAIHSDLDPIRHMRIQNNITNFNCIREGIFLKHN